jgi:RNA polymerase sigma factor (sigma-70 family)
MAISDATQAAPPAARPTLRPRLGDNQLARLATDRDPRAFEAIYARYHQELYRYCRALVGNAADAEDALQGTMAAALRSLPGETRQIALRPWLYRVAHNEAISIVRRRQPVVDGDQMREGTAEGVEAEAESRQRLRQLVADLGALPDRQRSALVMRELSGLSYDEIGAALDASAHAARQTVYEARFALAELESGREMDCDEARSLISARDGRILRGRRLRAHLRGCDPCREFRAAIRRRRLDLRAIAPPLPAVAAAKVLAGVVGGSGGAGTAAGGAGGGAVGAAAVSGGGAAAGAGGAVSSGGLAGAIAASAGVKAASIAAAVAIGAGAAGATGVVKLPLIGGGSGHRAARAPAAPAQAIGHSAAPPAPSSIGGATRANPGAGSATYAHATPSGEPRHVAATAGGGGGRHAVAGADGGGRPLGRSGRGNAFSEAASPSAGSPAPAGAARGAGAVGHSRGAPAGRSSAAEPPSHSNAGGSAATTAAHRSPTAGHGSASGHSAASSPHAPAPPAPSQKPKPHPKPAPPSTSSSRTATSGNGNAGGHGDADNMSANGTAGSGGDGKSGAAPPDTG